MSRRPCSNLAHGNPVEGRVFRRKKAKVPGRFIVFTALFCPVCGRSRGVRKRTTASIIEPEPPVLAVSEWEGDLS